MFDNHIQNICVAQMKRGEEKNKEIEEQKGGTTRVEKKGGEKVVSRRTGREGGEEEGKGMNRRIEKNRGAGGGLCSVLFILSVQVDNKKDRTEKNEIIIVIMINKKQSSSPSLPVYFLGNYNTMDFLSFFLTKKSFSQE